MNSLESAVRSANPVPDPASSLSPDVAARILHLSIERLETTAENRAERRGRGVWLSAAAVIPLVVVGIMALSVQSRPDVSAADEPNAALALAYLDARNSYDSEAALLLLADNLQLDEYPILRDASELETAFEYLSIIDEQLSVSVCKPSADDEAEVVCGYEVENLLIEAAGVEALPGIVRFRIEDGRISELENILDFADHEDRVLRSFLVNPSTRLGDRFHEVLRFAFRGEEVVLSPRLEALDQLTAEIEIYVRG